MDFEEYQYLANKTDTAVNAKTEQERFNGYMEKVLGLAGETGEVVEKIKKHLRDKDNVFYLTTEELEELGKELGDVLWYLSAIAKYNGVSLQYIAEKNLEKLEDRKARDKIHGNGDNR
jgi:nucleotide pyrophosphatase, mazG family